MSKIYFQGTFGAYSHLAALSIDPKAEIIPCKTFDECFLKATKDTSCRIIIPESNRITGNIGIEYLIFKYRLNIYSEYFQRVEYVNEHFSGWQPGWETDRGMIYILFGPPDEIQRTNPSAGNSTIYQIWNYLKVSKQFVFRDQNGFGDYRLDTPFIGSAWL